MRKSICDDSRLMNEIQTTSSEKTVLLNSFIMAFAHKNSVFPDALVIDLIKNILSGNLTKIEEIALELMINPKQFPYERAGSCYQELHQRLCSAPTEPVELETEVIEGVDDDDEEEEEEEEVTGRSFFFSQQSSTLFSTPVPQVEVKKSFDPIYTIWIGEPIKDPTSKKFLHDVLGPNTFAALERSASPVTFVCSDESVSWYINIFRKLDVSEKIFCVGVTSLFQKMLDSVSSAANADDEDCSLLVRAKTLFSHAEQLKTVRDKVSCKELMAWCILAYLGGVVIDSGVIATMPIQFPSSNDFRFPVLKHRGGSITPDVYLLQSPRNNPVVKKSLEFFVGQLEILRFLSASFKNNPQLCEALHEKIEQHECFMRDNGVLEILHNRGEAPLSLLAALESTLVMHSFHAGLYGTMEQSAALPVHPFTMKILSLTCLLINRNPLTQRLFFKSRPQVYSM